MKTVLLFTGGLDSTYLAYKILTDTSDELTLYLIRSKEFSPYNPDWSTTPYQIEHISKNIDILKNIRDFEVVIDDVNVSNITFEIDNPIAYSFHKIIPKINDGTYDRIATGHSYDHCSMRYFKYLDIPGVGGDKIAKKMFETTATRGSVWFPFITHDIHENYGRCDAMKNLPYNLNRNVISCLSTTSIASGPCGKCGKCEMNKLTIDFMSKGYSAADIQSWLEEKSLEYGGGNRCAPPPIWLRTYNNKVNVFEYGLDKNTNKKFAKVNNKSSFIEWWDSIVYNYPIDKQIIKWKKTSEEWKKLIL